MHQREGSRSRKHGGDAIEKTIKPRGHDEVTPTAVARAGDPAYAARLTDPAVDRAVCGALRVHGWPACELPDGLQEVRQRAVRAFARGMVPPATVDEMKALCARVARNCAVDRLRKRRTAERTGDAGPCDDPDGVAPLQRPYEHRDPVDAGRQLEIAAELFRRGKMPEHGVDILEGIASGLTYDAVAEEEGLSRASVQGRLKTMRRVFGREVRKSKRAPKKA